METITANAENIERAVIAMLSAIGENPAREGLQGTPERIARMCNEIFRGYDEAQKPKITTFENEEESEDLVFDTGEYYSMCEHHILPFFGKYYFAYIPSKEGRILGISKIARVVGYCSARLQLQERLAKNVLDMLEEACPAQGFAIMMKGQHLCKTMRGVKNKGEMVVTRFTGVFADDESMKDAFMKMVNSL